MAEIILERHLKNTFDQQEVELQLARQKSNIITIVGLPSVGISIFIKYLATHNKAQNIQIDLYDLSTISQSEFYSLLLKNLDPRAKPSSEIDKFDLCLQKIKKMIKEHGKLNLYFNRFDQLKHEYDGKLFSSIIKLASINSTKLTLYLTANREFETIYPEILLLESHQMLQNYYYLKPFNFKICEELLKLFPQGDLKNSSIIRKAYLLSGGHYLLFQLIIRSQRNDEFLKDSYINLLLKEIYESFSFDEKSIIQGLISSKPVILSNFLINAGVINKSRRLFSVLLEEYILNNSTHYIGKNEQKLLDFLKQNLDRKVTKEAIIDYVWTDNPEEVTDWALNSLVYRLRKNSYFTNSGYAIQNIKKQGYILVRK